MNPIVLEYLKVGLQREQLVGLLADANLAPREAVRKSKSSAKELWWPDPSVSREHLLDAMLEDPVLDKRPTVMTDKGTKLSRWSEIP